LNIYINDLFNCLSILDLEKWDEITGKEDVEMEDMETEITVAAEAAGMENSSTIEAPKHSNCPRWHLHLSLIM